MISEAIQNQSDVTGWQKFFGSPAKNICDPIQIEERRSFAGT